MTQRVTLTLCVGRSQVLRVELDQLYESYAREITADGDTARRMKSFAQSVAFLFALDYGILEAGWCSHRH